MGRGTQNAPDETVFVHVLVSGCARRSLPPCFGVSKSTVHRRFLIWSRAGVWGRLHEAVLHRLDDVGLLDVSRVTLDTAHVRAKKRGRTHRSEPRGPGQAGFQDAHPAGRERPAPPWRRLRRQCPRQRRTEADGGGAPNETRPPPRSPLQTPAPPRRQSLRPGRSAQMAARQADRRTDRPQRHRVRRGMGAPPMGRRADDVLAVRLPPPQPSLRTRSPQPPGVPRSCRRPLLPQATHPPHR